MERVVRRECSKRKSSERPVARVNVLVRLLAQDMLLAVVLITTI